MLGRESSPSRAGFRSRSPSFHPFLSERHLTGVLFTPRVPNTNINFNASGCATVEALGAGCTAPTPLTLSPTSGRPVQGATQAAVDCTTSNIPANALIHVGWTLPALPPAFTGFEFTAQAATLAAGFFDMDGRTSNGLKYTIGTL